MFRFTIRELVLVTVIVALALSWGISWTRLSRDLSDARRIAAKHADSAAAWETQATRLADTMREAGWRVQLSMRTFSAQWPSLEAYKEVLGDAPLPSPPPTHPLIQQERRTFPK
jgi:hypothetical protein